MENHFYSSPCNRKILISFMNFILILFIPVFLSSCEEVVDQMVDCVDFDNPEFDVDSLPDAFLGDPYSARIVASIGNEPDDESYDYEFFLYGDLPDGLKLVTEDYEPVTVIKGTPIKAGVFEFTLGVEVTPRFDDSDDTHDDGNDLCSATDSIDYSIRVTN
jgi:hypothetical protein